MKKATPVQINWKPDKNNPVPLYQQIVDYIYQKISSGDWPVGTRLPSQRALAEQFDVNRSTITSALDELTAFGIIRSGHGAGTLVINNTWGLMLPEFQKWEKYVTSGSFMENNQTIQTINRMEFEENIIRLGTGELDPRIFPKDKWNQVLKNLTPQIQSLGYLGPLGLPELQEALARHLASCGIHTSPSNILVTSGALQALQLISVVLLKPGSTVYTEAPSYMKSLQVFQSAGMRLSGVPMDEYGIQYWKLQNKTSLQSGHHSSILYTIPTNQNPTGITMEEGRRQELIDYCVSCQLPIIEDGAYLELCYAQEQPKTLKELDQSGMVIYLGTASKTLAPGLRIGWIVAPEPIVQRLGDVKMQMDYGASSISQWIFAEFLNSGLYGEYLQELKAILLHRRNCALKALQEHFSDLATWRIPKGGFYIWLTFKKELSVEMIFQEALKHRILLNPGDIYGFEKTNSLRLSFSYVTPEEFSLAAETLAKVVRHAV